MKESGDVKKKGEKKSGKKRDAQFNMVLPSTEVTNHSESLEVVALLAKKLDLAVDEVVQRFSESEGDMGQLRQLIQAVKDLKSIAEAAKKEEEDIGRLEDLIKGLCEQ